MRFELDHSSQLYQNFRKECIDNNAWHHISWDSTFKLMGFNTYSYNGDHYLADHEYTWFVLRFS